ncbi:MAG: glycosyltransferase family 4 protein [Methanomassiliicoccales archaeon]|jgi:glycosyltransferase involved in cell wall biosynthesis|nr:glycosyltransferase family 4 protein [Methanomassiliicoccales archaeon]MDD1756526.1 glycosyltransferase family 4 protein [Methanomassiliicoccales archaeon]
MRIAFITFEYPPRLWGGAGVYAENLVTSLARLGHELQVYVPTPGGRSVVEDRAPGVVVNRIGSSLDRLPGFLPFCLRVTKRLERAKGGEMPDVVHVNSIGFFAFRDRVKGPAYVSTGHHLSAETVRKVRPRIVDRILDFRGESGHLSSMMERSGARFPDRFIAVSQETKRSLRSIYHVPERLVDVVWNGVDPRGAPAGPQDREALRARLGLPPGPMILFVGRVDDPRKDLLTLVRAMALVQREQRASLVAVGGGLSTRAERLAKELGVHDRLFFRGRVSPEDLWSTYLVADAYVCASLQEGFGITILESLCAGCKVISTEVGVASELRDRIETVVPSASPEPMARAITDALASPGRSGLAEVRVPPEFTWERSAKQTLAVYEKALETRRGRGSEKG